MTIKDQILAFMRLTRYQRFHDATCLSVALGIPRSSVAGSLRTMVKNGTLALDDGGDSTCPKLNLYSLKVRP